MNVRLATIGDYVEPVATWNPATKPEDRFVYIDLSAVDQTEKQITSAASVLGSEAPSRARQLVRKGDILVSTVRPNLNGVAPVSEAFDGATASTGFCVLRPRPEKLSSNYLMHWVRSPQFVELMVKQATGASYPAVSERIVKGSPIPLPALDEQRRIAAILDKADALRRKRKRAVELLDGLIQTMFLEMFNDEANLVELGSICSRVTDGTHQAPNWADSGVPFLFVSNVRNQLISFKTSKFVSEDEFKRLTKNTPIDVGDVLYTAVGSYGNSAVVSMPDKFVFQRHIAQLKPLPAKVSPYYLSIALESPKVKAQADKLARGVAQKTVTLDSLKKFLIPLPSLEEQNRFADLASTIHEGARKMEASSNQLSGLFTSLQSLAFSGQL